MKHNPNLARVGWALAQHNNLKIDNATQKIAGAKSAVGYVGLRPNLRLQQQLHCEIIAP